MDADDGSPRRLGFVAGPANRGQTMPDRLERLGDQRGQTFPDPSPTIFGDQPMNLIRRQSGRVKADAKSAVDLDLTPSRGDEGPMIIARLQDLDGCDSAVGRANLDRQTTAVMPTSQRCAAG